MFILDKFKNMLIKLFGSNARAKILKIFLFQPDNKYYIRQLARDLNLQVNSVRRELDNLESFGLLTSEMGEGNNKDGGEIKKNTKEKKYYKVDKDFPLFEDIKSLIVKSQILHKDEFVRKLKKVGNPKLLILTGIFVNKLDSMIDVLVVGKVNKESLKKIIVEMEKDVGREINFSLMNSAEFKYRREITDIFLYDILEGKNIIVIDEIGIT